MSLNVIQGLIHGLKEDSGQSDFLLFGEHSVMQAVV